MDAVDFETSLLVRRDEDLAIAVIGFTLRN